MNNLKIKTIVEEVIKEYFALVGPSLPTAGSVSHQTVGPFAQHIRSVSGGLDIILQSINDDVAEIEDVDAQELLFVSIPALLNKIDTLKSAIERRAGLDDPESQKREPIVSVEKRKKYYLKRK